MLHKSNIAFAILTTVVVITFFVARPSQDTNFVFEQDTVVTGHIAKPPEHRENNQRFVFLPHDSEHKILITTTLYPRYHYGQQLEVSGIVRQPQSFDDTFDYQTYLAKDGIYAVMYQPEIELIGQQNVIFANIFKIRNQFEQAINQSVNEPNAAFINGILLGIRTSIPQDLKDDFQATGTTHILAISGYNITLVVNIIMSLLTIVMVRQRAFFFAVIGIVIFAIMVGAEASVVRAAIMGIIVLLAKNIGRVSTSHIVLALAAVIMIAINPLVIRYDVGFQLSFMATIGLLYVAPVLERYFVWVPKRFELREIVVMTLSAQLAVLPLLLYHFGSLSLVSLPANILVLPFVPFTMLAGFVTGLIGMFVPILGQLVGIVAWLTSSMELWIIQLFAQVPGAMIQIKVNWLGAVILYVLIFGMLLYIRNKHHDYSL